MTDFIETGNIKYTEQSKHISYLLYSMLQVAGESTLDLQQSVWATVICSAKPKGKYTASIKYAIKAASGDSTVSNLN